MDEFKKYIKDYIADHPEEELQYWSEYPPYLDLGAHYGIYTFKQEKLICSHCGRYKTPQVKCAGESGLIFEITTEEA